MFRFPMFISLFILLFEMQLNARHVRICIYTSVFGLQMKLKVEKLTICYSDERGLSRYSIDLDLT